MTPAPRLLSEYASVGNPLHQRLTLAQKGESLAGKAGSDEVEGTLKGGAVQFVSKQEGGGRNEYSGAVSGDGISGTVVLEMI